MKTKLMLTLLLSAPMAVRAMEVEKADAGAVVVKSPLADFMHACGAGSEAELAKQVRARVEALDEHSHATIIKGLRHLAQHSPDKLARLQSVVAQKRSAGDAADQPVDQTASIACAVDVLTGAIASGESIANNWNQTSTAGNVEKILDTAVTTLAVLVDKGEKTGCFGLRRRQAKPAAPQAASGQAASVAAAPAAAAPVAAAAPAPAAPQVASGQAAPVAAAPVVASVAPSN